MIDDASPDGTGELADRLAAELSVVEVLHRTAKEGLGPAYLAGFRHALAARRASSSLEMDCDFSHDPADVPRLVAAAAGADLVLGSRYVSGGGTRNWGPVAGAISPGRLLLRAGPARSSACATSPAGSSASAGTCWRRIDLDRISSKGYAFQIETTYRAIRAGFRVVEVPIVFSERRGGRLEDERRRSSSRRSGEFRSLRLQALRGGSDPAGYTRAVEDMQDVTDETFEQEVLAVVPARRRRFLGSLVRPLPRRSPRSCEDMAADYGDGSGS